MSLAVFVREFHTLFICLFSSQSLPCLLTTNTRYHLFAASAASTGGFYVLCRSC
uniref:Uncharacterized protein n=1 Tax=Hyaloperonospora arabidopsidis (strain Emoy2) TaxID=559515 RepID=M4B540_HYAAE